MINISIDFTGRIEAAYDITPARYTYILLVYLWLYLLGVNNRTLVETIYVHREGFLVSMIDINNECPTKP